MAKVLFIHDEYKDGIVTDTILKELSAGKNVVTSVTPLELDIHTHELFDGYIVLIDSMATASMIVDQILALFTEDVRCHIVIYQPLFAKRAGISTVSDEASLPKVLENMLAAESKWRKN